MESLPAGPSGRYFVTRQSTQNEGAQPLLGCVVLSDANEIKMRHFAYIMRNEQISCGNHSSVIELFSMSVGWRDDKMQQNELKVCALTKACSCGAKDPFRESNTYLTEPVHVARGAAPRYPPRINRTEVGKLLASR